ncbi:hypothetical protein B9Q04_02275 [Candidatus Marsarchaeota G2 archaeon BE_D]|uniref:Uncharacterized protein n=1 Tax=Candidatus Marsarchaeota G2 archaeon BE_D TaxID=1978158 RepID=A0A2R6CE14_9ARCH|nr:MAG: hypothetical protein B9Q04_02275 [Candidatus Marsarchaeota G2 archaeon BE_D]
MASAHNTGLRGYLELVRVCLICLVLAVALTSTLRGEPPKIRAAQLVEFAIVGYGLLGGSATLNNHLRQAGRTPGENFTEAYPPR